MYWTYLKTFVFILILILLAGGGYVFYRFNASSSSNVADYFNNGSPVTAARCTFTGSSFSAAINGVLFFDGLKLRAEWQQAVQGVLRKAHAVSLDGRMFYTWNDENDVAFTTTVEEFLNDFIFFGIITKSDCEPWWFPDGSIFSIPDEFIFRPYSQ